MGVQEIQGGSWFGSFCVVWSENRFAKAFDDVVEISSSRFLSSLPLLWKLKRFLNVGSSRFLSHLYRSIPD
jgi:hypothetical protein